MGISVKEAFIGIGVVLCYFCFPRISYADTLVKSPPKNLKIRILEKKDIETLLFFHSLKNQKSPENWGKRKNGSNTYIVSKKSPQLLSSPLCDTPNTEDFQDISYRITMLLYPHHIFW
ncbi:hypothetical protein [Sinomicrobium sp. M5D2P9]